MKITIKSRRAPPPCSTLAFSPSTPSPPASFPPLRLSSSRWLLDLEHLNLNPKPAAARNDPLLLRTTRRKRKRRSRRRRKEEGRAGRRSCQKR